MENASKITRYSGQQDYLNNAKSKKLPNKVKNALKNKAKENLDISKKAKELKDSKLPKKVKEASKDTLKTGAKKLLTDALQTAANLNTIPLPGIGQISLTNNSVKKGGAIKNRPIAPPILKPAVFFISGFDMNLSASSSSDGGIEEMAKFFKGAEHYTWSQEDEMMEMIKRRPLNQPVVLVGHSFGGDTAVNMANELNSMENGFRKVDLLITLDSVGFNNDIIPRNVDKNLNYISDHEFFLNDGPNIARNTKDTDVLNILRGEEHTSLDNANDVQFKIFKTIGETLQGRKPEAIKLAHQQGLELTKSAQD
jgi:pimeloyl-ACP methyl ester carboxylesterase